MTERLFHNKKLRCEQLERKKKFPKKLIIYCSAFSVIPTLLPPLCVIKAIFKNKNGKSKRATNKVWKIIQGQITILSCEIISLG